MNYLVIEGNIGAGKTSLANRLAEDMGARLILEKFAENPFLPKFYSDPAKYSFPLELSFLAERYKQHKEQLTHRDMFAPLAIADYYFSKSLIFAAITLPVDEYNLYRQLYNIIHQHLPLPDLYVYLYLPVENLMKNIGKRGRDYERGISSEYLTKLQDGYFVYMKGRKDMKSLVIDTRNIDFVNNQDDYLKLKDAIFNHTYVAGITRIIL
ncbi:MAG TPA: deoxynucleoside kinase [Bacteroidales bacterium]|nr:deoxynucleoside kinase [Bacteroidales bacterium]